MAEEPDCHHRAQGGLNNGGRITVPPGADAGEIGRVRRHTGGRQPGIRRRADTQERHVRRARRPGRQGEVRAGESEAGRSGKGRGDQRRRPGHRRDDAGRKVPAGHPDRDRRRAAGNGLRGRDRAPHTRVRQLHRRVHAPQPALRYLGQALEEGLQQRASRP